MFGTRIESTLILVVYASVWQVLIQVLYGVQDVDPWCARPRGPTGWGR